MSRERTMSREDRLREYANQDDADIAHRVYKTLRDEREIAKAIGELVKHLHQRNLISGEEIDELLLACVADRRAFS